MVREYQRVTDETRRRLIKYIQEGSSIKEAAALVNINYENAKAINRIYKQETRVEKKKSRFRYRRDEDRDAAKR
jgi:molybdenum-dependent DNA-binding transcriptional regulator ModE